MHFFYHFERAVNQAINANFFVRWESDFKLSITQDGGPCLRLSNNWSTLSLSSFSFVLFPEEASYLCITGPQYSLTSLSILSCPLVISIRSLENHRFHQLLLLSAVSMSRGDILWGSSCLLHYLLIYLSV